MSKETGGSAFGEFERCGDLAVQTGGLTIRDYFAAKALPHAASRYTEAHEDGEYLPEDSYPQVAFGAYKLADAMLAERAK